MAQASRARPARAKVVELAERRSRSGFADASEVTELAKEMKQAYLECRELGHLWRPWMAQEIRDERLGRHWERTLRCGRCRSKRNQILTSNGSVVSNSYSYADGYVNKGLGRIVGEARDALRAESLRRHVAGGR